MNDELEFLSKGTLKKIDASLKQATDFLERGDFSRMFQPKHAPQPAPESANLPTPDQLADLAALVADKDALFKEFDADVAKHEKNEPRRSPIDNALRRALHLRMRAIKMLEHAASLDAVGYASFIHDWETAIALDRVNIAKREEEAWRFYPEQTEDDLRRHLHDNGVEGEFKRHGLPCALRRWQMQVVGLTKKQANDWWKSRKREGGCYHAVYQWEITHFIGWNVENHRKANCKYVAKSRGKDKIAPMKSAKKPMAAAA